MVRQTCIHRPRTLDFPPSRLRALRDFHSSFPGYGAADAAGLASAVLPSGGGDDDVNTEGAP